MSYFIFTLLSGLALYPLVANHNKNQRENALLVLGSLVLGFIILEQRAFPSMEEGSFIYGLFCLSSYLLFALGYLNRREVKTEFFFNPIAPIVTGSTATLLDALILNPFISILAIAGQLASFIWLTQRYHFFPLLNRIKSNVFMGLYTLTWLFHATSSFMPSSDNNIPHQLSLISVYLLITYSLLHMLWQDFSKARAQKLGHHATAVDAAAVKLSYEGRRILKDIRHDLRQPLSTLGILASVGKAISRDPDIITRYEHIQTAQRALKTMLEQTFEQLGEALQYPAIRKNPEFHSFSIPSLLEPLVNEYRLLANTKGLEMRYHPLEVDIHSNSEALTKIIRNGLDNAIKYTQEGGVLVAARKKGKYIAIQVIDTGPGIHSDEVAEHQKGWGHGSSIIKELSEKLHLQTHIKNRTVHNEVRGSLFEVLIELTSDSLTQTHDSMPVSDSSRIIAEILVNGQENTNFIQNILPVDGFDEVRYGKLNLYKSYSAVIRKGPASIYIAWSTTEEEFNAAVQSLKTISRLLNNTPCCVVIYSEDNENQQQIEYKDNLIYLPVNLKNPETAFRNFADFFPGRKNKNEKTPGKVA